MTVIKTCGIVDIDASRAAMNAGADYLGYIHYPRSPRHRDLKTINELAALAHADQRQQSSVRTVLVVVDPDNELVEQIADMGQIDLVQLHGKESLARVEAVAKRIGKPIIKAVSVRTAADVDAAQDYVPHVHALLFDAKPPQSDDFLPGGNGLSFDWTILNQDWLNNQLWFLSGGLTAENVAQAIHLTHAPGVDVSSGIEAAPGKKDKDKIRAFLRAAKGSDSGHSYGT